MPQKILTLTSELQDVSPKLLFPILQTLEFSAGSIRAVHLLYFLGLKTYVPYLAVLYLSETNTELKKVKNGLWTNLFWSYVLLYSKHRYFTNKNTNTIKS